MTISDSIYQTLKSKIILQEIPPASHLKEDQIAKMLNVTRTPIREAIIKLEREGLVTIQPNVGASVVRLSEKDIDEILEVRTALETRAAYNSIKIASKDDLNKIKKTLDGRKRFLDGDKNKDFDFPGMDFHRDLIKLSKNKKFVHFWELLDAQLKLVRVKSSLVEGRHLFALEEHQQILFYMFAGDYKMTEKLLTEHIKKVKTNFLLY